MRDLASAAGLNVASLYHYFPSKRDLLESVLIEQGFLPIRPEHMDRRGETPDVEPLTLAQLLAEIMTSMFEVEDFVRLMVGEAMRGEATARAVGVDLFASFESSIEDWVKSNRPDLDEGRAPPRWPGSSAPWWSGSSFSTPPTCSARKGMTSPPCPWTGPARRLPSSGRRAEPDATCPAARAPAHTDAVPDTTPTSRADRRRLRRLRGAGRDRVGLPSRLRQPARLQPRRAAASPGSPTGASDAVGGVHGPGARYTFGLADPRRPGCTSRSSCGSWTPWRRRWSPPACRAAATPTRSSW